MSIGQNAELKKQLTSLSLSMDFERSLEILDILLKETITDSSYPIELIDTFLRYVAQLKCDEKANVLEMLYARLATFTDTNIDSHLFLVFDVLATALKMHCPFRFVNSDGIGRFIDSALGCLQSKTIPTSSSHMLSVLDFILALCKSSCNSFTWMTQITPRRPDGLPLRLLLLVIEIELKLRLPSNLEGYLRVKADDEKMLHTCLELLSLLISEISVSRDDLTDDMNDGVIGSMSDEALTIIMNQLIEIGDLMVISLAPDQDLPSLTDAQALSSSSTNFQVPSLLLRTLSVYLQWILSSYKDQFLTTTDGEISSSALFDHTLFQPLPPETKEYQSLVKTFEVKVWEPLKPLMGSVIPMVFSPPIEDGPSTQLLGLCRKFILRLARLFPSVVLTSFNGKFYENLLAKCSTEEEGALKSPSGLSFLTDVSALLDITMSLSSLESSSGDFSDVCIGVVGRLFSLLSRSNWGSSVLKILVLKDNPDEGLCEECINIKRIQLLERFSDALALLRFLVVNLWQEEMAFCLRIAELTTPDGIGEKRESDPEKWLASAFMTCLQRLTKLKPESLLDLKLSNQQHPALRGFYTSYTLSQSAEALFQCCHSSRDSEFCKHLMRKQEFKQLATKICLDY
ncbi:unnamed protein product [Hymenolepis diminuta]|uniref:Exportin-4 n=1 Tax=Hymenolepis diminuta TaxID=6216 RepID=A0A0R3SCU1_HYMDI|nr:unnamed protein product [Hymenolepis diminuta]